MSKPNNLPQYDYRAGKPPARNPGPPTALDTQVGGDHYKVQGIQPVTYIAANGLDFFSGSVVKYVTRHKLKGGKQDLEKAIHYLQMLIEFEYPEETVEPEQAPFDPTKVLSVILSDECSSLDRLDGYKKLAKDLGLHRVCFEQSARSFESIDAYGTLVVVKASIELIKNRYPKLELGKTFLRVLDNPFDPDNSDWSVSNGETLLYENTDSEL